MEYLSPTIEEYTERIRNKDHFTLARYGDGEWASILGDRGQNCDGIKYTKQLKTFLEKTVKEPGDYEYGILQIAVRSMGDRISEYLRRHRIKINWLDATFLVAANRNGKMFPFIEALRARRIMYVGPSHLQHLHDQVFPIENFVHIPGGKAFEKFMVIRDRILHSYTNDIDLIAVSAGPAAKVLIHYLNGDFGDSLTIVDFGSLWDGYVGINSRLYMQRPSWEIARRKNLGLS